MEVIRVERGVRETGNREIVGQRERGRGENKTDR